MVKPSAIVRARARATRRGAAVFVVILVITLLTALGLFAVRSTSLTMRASGFNRQLVQTHYVDDYAVLAAAAFANEVGKPLYDMARGGNQDTGCMAYSAMQSASKFQCCKLMSFNEVNGYVNGIKSSNELIEQPSDGTPGSLGPVALEADMRIEMADCYEGAHASVGENVGSQQPSQQRRRPMFTFTVTAMVRPPQQTANQWDTASAAAAGLEMAQARVLFPPVQ